MRQTSNLQCSESCSADGSAGNLTAGCGLVVRQTAAGSFRTGQKRPRQPQTTAHGVRLCTTTAAQSPKQQGRSLKPGLPDISLASSFGGEIFHVAAGCKRSVKGQTHESIPHEGLMSSTKLPS
ncbi:hypothetical protein WJX82_005464 [Trebouxia sp. C0006]